MTSWWRLFPVVGLAVAPPPDGLTLEDEIAVNKILLASGCAGFAMNAVRKHLPINKGGRLAAAAHPAKVFSLVVSDIPGDNPVCGFRPNCAGRA